MTAWLLTNQIPNSEAIVKHPHVFSQKLFVKNWNNQKLCVNNNKFILTYYNTVAARICCVIFNIHLNWIRMDEHDFEGTLVLEKLAEINKVDDFFDAVDADDFQKAKSLMKRAGVDAQTMALVLKKMGVADGQH